MARLVGVDLPREKRLEIALTYIFGVGRTRAVETLAATGISPDKRVKDLSQTAARHPENILYSLLYFSITRKGSSLRRVSRSVCRNRINDSTISLRKPTHR